MTAPVPATAPHLAAVQALRGVAALLVMVSHLWIIEQKYSPDQLLGRWAEFGMVGVDLFFAISGFIMVYVTHRAPPKGSTALSFLFARMARIYPIYWIVSFALFLIWLWRPEMVFAAFQTPPDILKSFTLWPDERPPLLAVGWTLTHEVFFYLLFALTLLFDRRYLLPFLAGWAAITMMGHALGGQSLGAEGYLAFSPLTLEFIFGALAGWAYIRLQKVGYVAALLAGLAGFALAFAIITATGHHMPVHHWVRITWFALPSALLVYGLACFASDQVPRFMVRLGDWSYALYLTHILSLSLVGKIWASFAWEGYADNILMLVVSAGFAIIVAGLTWTFLEKPILNISKGLRQRLFPQT